MEGQNLVKTIHIELSDERCHVGVFVIVGKQRAGKLTRVTDTETVAITSPADVVIW